MRCPVCKGRIRFFEATGSFACRHCATHLSFPALWFQLVFLVIGSGLFLVVYALLNFEVSVVLVFAAFASYALGGMISGIFFRPTAVSSADNGSNPTQPR